jgi:hypothetical protein
LIVVVAPAALFSVKEFKTCAAALDPMVFVAFVETTLAMFPAPE